MPLGELIHGGRVRVRSGEVRERAAGLEADEVAEDLERVQAVPGGERDELGSDLVSFGARPARPPAQPVQGRRGSTSAAACCASSQDRAKSSGVTSLACLAKVDPTSTLEDVPTAMLNTQTVWFSWC